MSKEKHEVFGSPAKDFNEVCEAINRGYSRLEVDDWFPIERKVINGVKVVAADIHGDGDIKGWFDRREIPANFPTKQMVFDYVEWCVSRKFDPARSPTTVELFCNGWEPDEE